MVLLKFIIAIMIIGSVLTLLWIIGRVIHWSEPDPEEEEYTPPTFSELSEEEKRRMFEESANFEPEEK